MDVSTTRTAAVKVERKGMRAMERERIGRRIVGNRCRQ